MTKLNSANLFLGASPKSFFQLFLKGFKRFVEEVVSNIIILEVFGSLN